jgi:AraC-like DNA-binding protein
MSKPAHGALALVRQARLPWQVRHGELAAMFYQSHTPGPPLDRFVECIWLYSGYQPGHSMEKVLPHGGLELVIDLQDRPRRLHDPRRIEQVRWFRRSWLSGLHTEHIVIGADADSAMMGVRFRPGGAAPFLPFPPCELAQQVVELEHIWGRRAGELHDALLDAPSVAAKLRTLEIFLVRLAAGRLESRPIVAEALRRLAGGQGQGPVRDLAADLGVSHKHLIHLFDCHVGLAPKAMQRVLRFDRALQQISAGRAVDWVGLAHDCGYYDQAHFINEFQAFSGMTPTVYDADERKMLYFVPI